MKRKNWIDWTSSHCPSNEEAPMDTNEAGSSFTSTTSSFHIIHKPGNVTNLFEIYKELRTCSSLDEVHSLKNKLDPRSPESCADDDDNVGDLFKDMNYRLKSLNKRVDQLNSQGRFDEVTIREEVLVKLPTTELVGEQFHSNMNEIEAYLKMEEFLIIGIHGMGGVGKTTLVKHVHNKIVEDPDIISGSVFWITVSKDCTIHNLQSIIARRVCDDDLVHEDDELIRAGILREALEGRDKFIICLDDMWNYLDLTKVGIPEKNGCKLILTTRSIKVCIEMRCNMIFKLDPLPEEEAWTLFVKNLGYDITPKIEDTAKLVAKECAGLPLGIITLSRSMRISDDIREWKNMLKNLRKSKVGDVDMETDVFRILRFSYDRLSNRVLKECLLYCATYAEDYQIQREELTLIFIGLGLFGKGDSMEEMLYSSNAVLNELERACLLSPSCFCDKSGIYRQCVKMHDLIRDMALQIAESRFMVKAGMGLKDFPGEEEWTEELEVVSLIGKEYIETCDISPDCPRLSVIILEDNIVQHSFFTKLQGLKVLRFRSNIGFIKVFPNSILSLKSLTALLLGGCDGLENVPSLANLTTLMILDLSYTDITEVPDGLKMLTNLRYLSFAGCYSIQMFPSGVLPSLCRLECLHLHRQVGVEELKSLRQLESLEYLHFDGIDDFNAYVEHMDECQSLEFYKIQLGDIFGDADGPFVDGLKLVCLSEVWDTSTVRLPKDVQELAIIACDDIRSLSDIQSLDDDVKYLEICWVCNCDSFKYVLSPPVSSDIFSRLTELYLYECSNMKIPFTMASLMHFQNLEVFDVERCEMLEHIIGESEGEDATTEKGMNANTFVLPKLMLLRLSKLRTLKSICSFGVLISPLSEYDISIEYCPKLQINPMPVAEASLPLPLSRFKHKRWIQL